MAVPKAPRKTILGEVKYLLGRAYMRVFGWELVGQPPDAPKHVMIAAPHTSNWDLVIMLACGWSYRITFSWLGKKEIFQVPLLGPFLRWTGGVAIDRKAAKDTVAQVVSVFEEAEQMHLCISPEGTRSHRDHWRSGFYHIARGAKVPIACGFIDYARRRAGYGPVFRPSGDVTGDMDQVRQFYQEIGALRPEKKAPIRLREEMQASETAPQPELPVVEMGR